MEVDYENVNWIEVDEEGVQTLTPVLAVSVFISHIACTISFLW